MSQTCFLPLVVLTLLAMACPAQASDREGLKAVDLSAGRVPAEPLPTSVFEPVEPAKPANKFPGRLVIAPRGESARSRPVRDGRGRLENAQNAVGMLPRMAIELVQTGNQLLPLERSLVAPDHPYWDYFVGVGKAWDEAGDGGWTRAVLPFALQERNQNCTHNGLMSFLYRSDGAVSQVYFQIGSESCAYFQADFWGMAPARATAGTEPGAEAVAAFRTERARRLPVRPIAALAEDFPGSDPAKFAPPAPDDVSVYGLVADGVHYRGGCQTRFGPYTLCDELHLPSYSLAKSAFAGLAYMRMARRWPAFPQQFIADLVPPCALPDGRWDDVTVDDALDMTTGNFDSLAYMADEDDRVGSFLSEATHAGKVDVACGEYGRNGSPGSQWVYHTSDTYLVVAAMDAWLRRQEGQDRDSYRDVVVREFWTPLALSPVTHDSVRTQDEVAQAAGGFGLTFLSDDAARIGQFLGPGQGLIDGQLLFDAAEFDRALFRGAGASPEHKATALFAYSNGFWGAPGQAWAACDGDVWIPHMSGFGGITLALMPNGMTYYVFADSGLFQWSNAAAEANRMRSYCP